MDDMTSPSRRTFVATTGVLAAGSVLGLREARAATDDSSGTTDSGGSDAPWPQYQGDAAHTGYVDADGPDAGLDRKWAADTGPSLSNPAVAEGRVYVATGNAKLVAVDGDDGSIAWRTDTNYYYDGQNVRPYSYASPTYADGSVFVTTDSGGAGRTTQPPARCSGASAPTRGSHRPWRTEPSTSPATKSVTRSTPDPPTTSTHSTQTMGA